MRSRGGYTLLPGDYSGEENAVIGSNASWVTIANSSNLAAYEKSNGDMELTICNFPAADKATVAPTYVRPAMLWSIAATTKNPELSAAFINYYVNETSVYDISGTDRGVPISSEIRDYLNKASTPADVAISAYLDFLAEDGKSSVISNPIQTTLGEAGAVLSGAAEKIAYSQIKRADLLTTAQQTIDAMNEKLSAK